MTAYVDSSLVALAAALRAPGVIVGRLRGLTRGQHVVNPFPLAVYTLSAKEGAPLHIVQCNNVYLFCTAQRDSTAHGAQSTEHSIAFHC